MIATSSSIDKANIAKSKVFEGEYEKYNKELNVLGDKIAGVSKKYDEISTTRTKKLTQVIEKIKGENLLENNNSNKLE